MHDDLEQRKSQHLELAMRPEIEPGTDSLLSCVKLVHCALPELRLDEVDLSARLCGASLRAPLMIVGMTGGTERAGQINRDLARLAEEEGLAFGVGSMRAVLRDEAALATFDVQPARPPLLMANLGAQQLAQTPGAARSLIEKLSADGICIHLNAAQELVQEEGDRDFRGCLDAIGALAQELGEKLIVKETGCGISPRVARMLVARGVRTIDVSGAGGTSWTRVEELRAKSPQARALGALLSRWGLPTAAALGSVRAALDLPGAPQREPGAERPTGLGAPVAGERVSLIASGGIRDAMDAARALALGADVVGLPVLRAHQQGGLEAARAALRELISSLRAIVLLCGAKDLAALRAAPRVIEQPLASHLAQLSRVPAGAR